MLVAEILLDETISLYRGYKIRQCLMAFDFTIPLKVYVVTYISKYSDENSFIEICMN
jgi:hypothetical protein